MRPLVDWLNKNTKGYQHVSVYLDNGDRCEYWYNTVTAETVNSKNPTAKDILATDSSGQNALHHLLTHDHINFNGKNETFMALRTYITDTFDVTRLSKQTLNQALIDRGYLDKQRKTDKLPPMIKYLMGQIKEED